MSRKLNELTKERCRQVLKQWGIPLSQLRIEKNGKRMHVAAYLAPGNAVDFASDDERETEELIAYLIEQGVPVDEVT
jgi:hypothetical protein